MAFKGNRLITVSAAPATGGTEQAVQYPFLYDSSLNYSYALPYDGATLVVTSTYADLANVDCWTISTRYDGPGESAPGLPLTFEDDVVGETLTLYVGDIAIATWTMDSVVSRDNELVSAQPDYEVSVSNYVLLVDGAGEFVGNTVDLEIELSFSNYTRTVSPPTMSKTVWAEIRESSASVSLGQLIADVGQAEVGEETRQIVSNATFVIRYDQDLAVPAMVTDDRGIEWEAVGGNVSEGRRYQAIECERIAFVPEE